MKKVLKYAGISLGAIFLVIQIFQVDHTNPEVRSEPPWDSPRTRELAKKACFDCHSAETNWPWYSYIAPASWKVFNNVKNGRRHFYFSEYPVGTKKPEEAIEEIEKGSMPPSDYLLLHSEAKLTPLEKAELIKGLRATFGLDKQGGQKTESEVKKGEKELNGREKREMEEAKGK